MLQRHVAQLVTQCVAGFALLPAHFGTREGKEVTVKFHNDPAAKFTTLPFYSVFRTEQLERTKDSYCQILPSIDTCDDTPHTGT